MSYEGVLLEKIFYRGLGSKLNADGGFQGIILGK